MCIGCLDIVEVRKKTKKELQNIKCLKYYISNTYNVCILLLEGSDGRETKYLTMWKKKERKDTKEWNNTSNSSSPKRYIK